MTNIPSHQALCIMMVEWLPDPDTQGGEVSSGRVGRLPVGGAQHQQAGLLLVSPVSRDSFGISKLPLRE